MGKLSNEELKALLAYLEQIGKDPDLELTPEIRKKIDFALKMHGTQRIVMANDGSVSIGNDASGNTFNLGPVIHLRAHEKPFLEEVISIHNFDLTELLDDCVDHLLFNQTGVIGFGLPCNIPNMLSSVCERLRIRLDCDCADVKDHVVLDLSYAASIDDITRDFLITHKISRLPNTIFSVQTFENDSAMAFWEKIKSIESNLPLDTRLILVMVVQADFQFPDNLYKLPPPIFRPAHVQDFFRKVVSSRKQEWDNPKINMVTNHWVQSLIKYCTTGDTIYHKTVYHYLKMTLDEFKGNADPDKFIGFLQELDELIEGV